MPTHAKPFGRAAFTLVEVALAVTVGLIVLGGVVLGYHAVKDNASNADARSRVLSAGAMVEEYAGANGGRYPTSLVGGGHLSGMWATKRSEDAVSSPWGGPTGLGTGPNDGVVEFAAANFGAATDPVGSNSAAVASASIPTALVVGNAANLCYISSSAMATPWAAVPLNATGSAVGMKNYALGIHDKQGTPWWHAQGGK